MTTPPYWPPSLPQNLLLRGYTESVANVTVSSQTDIGPAKIRRRSTAGPRPAKGLLSVDSSQLETLKGFYNTDLLGGSLRFRWVDPVDGATATEFRFTKPLSWSAEDGRFSVVLELEMLP